ncbi:MAG TPA: peptidylprolyl isomerase, partial [Blastocatellia bacterium]
MRSQTRITSTRLARHLRVRRRQLVMIFFVVAALATILAPRPRPQEKKRGKPDAQVTLAEAARLEAVITTDMGVIRFEFLPDKAPRHVQQFVKWAREGFYDGSAFFRFFARGLVQGGDPNLKEPAKPRNTWGTGALNLLPDEFSDIKHVRGTVS